MKVLNWGNISHLFKVTVEECCNAQLRFEFKVHWDIVHPSVKPPADWIYLAEHTHIHRIYWGLCIYLFEESLGRTNSLKLLPVCFHWLLTFSSLWPASPTFSSSRSLVWAPAAMSSVSTWQMPMSRMILGLGVQLKLVSTKASVVTDWASWGMARWQGSWEVTSTLCLWGWMIAPFSNAGLLGTQARFGSTSHLFSCEGDCTIAGSQKGTLPLGIIRLGQEAPWDAFSNRWRGWKPERIGRGKSRAQNITNLSGGRRLLWA